VASAYPDEIEKSIGEIKNRAHPTESIISKFPLTYGIILKVGEKRILYKLKIEIIKIAKI
jgi:hypothetical protein